jgi:mono/diheme cytochrome c family protein
VVHAIPQKAPGAAAATSQPMDAFLKWEGDRKETTVTNGTVEAYFSFTVTNISTTNVVVTAANGSCMCTVAKLPDLPWTIAPGAGGEIKAVMNLVGKSGQVPKVISVVTDKGTKMLTVTANILPPVAAPQMTAADREKNMKAATADRQAVFKGDCAKCHAEPAKGKMGQQLFVSVCGVCHESDHRASMVPNLHTIAQETNAEFWRNWILHGKPGSLMPAFSQAEGGILTDAQVTSLVNYLTAAIPSKPTQRVTQAAPTSN